MAKFFINLCGGAACGGDIALFFAIMKNKITFKKEEKISVEDIFLWLIIGFLMGAMMGAVFFTKHWLTKNPTLYVGFFHKYFMETTTITE